MAQEFFDDRILFIGGVDAFCHFERSRNTSNCLVIPRATSDNEKFLDFAWNDNKGFTPAFLLRNGDLLRWRGLGIDS